MLVSAKNVAKRADAARIEVNIFEVAFQIEMMLENQKHAFDTKLPSLCIRGRGSADWYAEASRDPPTLFAPLLRSGLLADGGRTNADKTTSVKGGVNLCHHYGTWQSQKWQESDGEYDLISVRSCSETRYPFSRHNMSAYTQTLQ